MYRRIMIVTGIATLFLTSLVSAQEQVNLKLGCVEIRKAFTNCIAGKEAADKLNKELEKAKTEYESQAEKLTREKETLERQGPLLAEEVLQDKMRHFQAKSRDLERFRQDAENDAKQQHNRMLEKTTIELLDVAQRIGKEGDYTLIVERTMVLYVDPSLDITEEVIKRYDAQHGKKWTSH